MTTPHKRAKDRGKNWEREVAKDLGTTRSGPTGKNDADVISERWGVECKALQSLQIRETHIQQAIKNAGDRPWVIPMKEYGTGRKIVIMDYKKWLEMEEMCLRLEIITKEYDNG